jgi:hypothetical protein
MKTYYCDSCGSPVFFENVKCLGCDHELGFLPDILDMSALEPAPEDSWHALAKGGKDRFRSCGNGRTNQICNWLVPTDSKDAYCVACRLNHTIPDLTVAGNHERWFKMESAKRRLIYTLLSLKLPLNGCKGRPALSFNFLADPPGGPPILTGHENGLITLNIAEADDDERERRRAGLHEPYRTLLGHFRHETGHYYWDQLIANSPYIGRFRELFGDETKEYSAALKLYHQQGAPADWQDHLISAYAGAHPWEDWAETWAHYLHMIDSVETAAGFGVSLRPKHPAAKTMRADPQTAIKGTPEFTRFLENWLPVTCVLNSLNRGMGLPDLYPFVLSAPVVEKLQFIHDTIRETAPGSP